ncbi:MAG: hypothetical protein HY094_01340 [Candidatus Melainabacteria bacterium]|nr:hypothetical protein [Candidatus Melainabacteria bacterium]
MDNIKRAFRLFAILLGLLQAWALQNQYYGDIISYIEIGEAYLHGDFNSAINGYCSPLYSWILAVFLSFSRPSPYWEYPFTIFINFLIYLFTLICFEYFLKEFIRYLNKNSNNSLNTFQEKELTILGYILFIYSSLVMITVLSTTPDLLVSAFIYLIAGILLQFKPGTASKKKYIIFGLILGFSYLAKAVMFPMVFIFLLVGYFLVRGLRQKLSYLILSLITFCLISSPFIFALSKEKGHLTFSEVGKLNYLWRSTKFPEKWDWYDRVPFSSGKPVHLMKKIFDNPTIFKFQNEFRNATYPPAYDISYWYDGAKLQFDLKEQINALISNIHIYYYIFIYSQKELFIIFIFLFYLTGQKIICLKNILKNWFLILPSLCVFFMYSLIVVEERYLGGYVVLLWLSLFSGISLKSKEDSKHVLSCSVLTILTVMLIRFTCMGFDYLSLTAQNLNLGKNANRMWCVANELKKLGLKEGDNVATFIDETNQYWARIGRFRIISEIPLNEETKDFWESNQTKIPEIIKTIAKTGAKVIVTENIPTPLLREAKQKGWRTLGNTNYFALFL